MKLSGLLFAFVIGAMVVVGIMFAAANLTSSTVGDTYGSATSAATNGTASLLTDVTAVGTGAGAGLVILLAGLGVLGGIVLVRAYSGR